MKVDWDNLLQDQPWKAFNGYQRAVNLTVVATAPSVTKAPAIPTPSLDDLDLESVVLEAQAMFDALPVSEKSGKRYQRCAGLPRAYPKFWMKRGESNSLSFEFRTVQNLKPNATPPHVEKLIARLRFEKDNAPKAPKPLNFKPLEKFSK